MYEIQVALCSAYVRIAKTCPPHIWKPESLVHLLGFPEPCFPLIDCFQVAVSILGPDHVGGKSANDTSLSLLKVGDKSILNTRIGEKRHFQDAGTSSTKRQKIGQETKDSNADIPVQKRDEFVDNMHSALLSLIEHLKPPSVGPDSLRSEVALTALSMLCFVFSLYPWTNMSHAVFKEMYAWIPWICEQVQTQIDIKFANYSTNFSANLNFLYVPCRQSKEVHLLLLFPSTWRGFTACCFCKVSLN